MASIVVVQDAVTGKILQKIRTRPDGTYSFNVPTGMKVNYFPEKKDYFSTSKLLDLTNVTTSMEVVDSVQVISNVEMKKGNAFVMPAVLFEASSFTMLPNSYNELNRLIQFVNTQKWKVQIIGHTDSNGTDEDNMTLSLQRADAVKQYMVKNGCNPNAILTKGMGESTPIGDNNTPDGQAKNRRVELKVETN